MSPSPASIHTPADLDMVVSHTEDNVGEVLDHVDSDSEDSRELVNLVKAQEVFQPGSTPMHKTKRYLAFNIIGVIEVTELPSHNVINVRFHNMSLLRPFHFPDQFRYDMAALGQRGVVFACQPNISQPAHVLYKPYSSWAWASSSEWKYELPVGTSVFGIAAGGPTVTEALREADIESLGNVVVATSDGDLVFLSGGGVERACLSLPGTYVTMVAGPEWVFLVTRDGTTTADGSQNLMGRLIRFDDFSTLQKDNLPVSKHHILTWVGVTEEGAPAFYDSSGALSVMPHFRRPLSAMWTRVLCTSRVKQDMGSPRSYWPVGVIDTTFHCLILRGEETYPGFPSPVLHEIPLCFPFKRVESRESQLEQRVIQETFLLHVLRDGIVNEKSAQELAEREGALDKTIIELIQHACQSNRQGRALDFARLLHAIPSFDVTIKLASSPGLAALVQAIQRLKVERGGSVWRGPSASLQSPKLTTSSSTGTSSRKRPRDKDMWSDMAKRPAVRESTPSATAMDKEPLLQSRGKPFSQKFSRKHLKPSRPHA